MEIQSRDTQDSNRNRITGYGDFLLANRISYEYDFKGPRYEVLVPMS
jgi:acyl transferase domain-containing protein